MGNDATDPPTADVQTVNKLNVPLEARDEQANFSNYSYWDSFVGDVLGAAGQMSGWVYESGNMDTPAIFLLGCDGATKLYTLPAKARFDNGTPFVQP